MASTSRRGLKVSDQNVKLTTTTTTTTTNSNNLLSQKSMPAILSRKRKSEHLEMDYSECFRFTNQSGSNSPWSVFPSDLNIFQVSNPKKANMDIEDIDEEEPMIVCLENLPPVEQKVRNINSNKFSVSSSSSRVPLGTINTNTVRPTQPMTSSMTSSKPKSSNIMKPKHLVEGEASPKAPPSKKLRLSQSWSHFREFVRTTSSESSHPRGITPFPEVRWADKQEIWDLICKKERGMYLRQTGDELLARHPCLQPRMRAILFDWLVEVCEVYRLHRETFYLAVDFIDRYLGTTSDMPKTRVQLIGVTCLFIAAKMEEIYPPKLQEFAYVTDGACSEDEILSMELVILKGLNWGLSPMTPNSWVKLYMQVNQAAYIVDINGANPPGNEDFVLPQFSGLRFSKVMQLLDLCVLDIGSLSFPYSVLSASAIYHCQDQATALQSSGYSWDELSPCINWMSSFVFALRESQNASSTLAPAKSMPNVSAEEVHNIQVHSIELAVLDRAQQRLALSAEQTNRQSPDLSQNPTRIISSVEMTPPEDSDYLDFPANSGSFGGKQSVVQNTTSSVFMSPSVSGDDW